MADYIPTAEAAKRAGISTTELLTTWAARHGVDLAYDASGKVIGVRAEQFEAAGNVDHEVRDLLSGERRQRKERERSRDDIQEHVRSTLGGDKSKVKQSKGDQLLGMIGTRREGQTDTELLRKWLKL